jgi:hypothetical protein
MALDRLLPVSTTPGAVTGDSYMDAVQEEVTGLWDRSIITLTAVAGTNTITATATPALTAGLVNGMMFILKPAATNTSTVTLNVNAGGAVAVVDAEGTALAAGALRINANYLIKYDSTFVKYSIVGYVPAAAIVVGSKLIKTLSGGGSSYDFVNGVSSVVLDDTYDTYELSLSNLIPATDDSELWLRVGTGGGPTYQTTLYDYSFRYERVTSPGTIGLTSQAKIVLAGETAATGAVSSSTSEAGASVTIRFDNPESAAIPKLFCYQGAWQASVNTPGTLYTCTGAGVWQSVTAITAIRIMFESGNITSGRASLYGITKA